MSKLLLELLRGVDHFDWYSHKESSG